MNWIALVLSVVLVAPAVAQSPQPSDSKNNKSGKDRKGETVILRACVLPGTHGSMANLSQVVAKDSSPAEPRRIIYWFYKNLNGFKDHHPGQLVEITGTVTEVLDESPELKATDGIFAEIQFTAGNVTASAITASDAVGPSGSTSAKPVATAGISGGAETDNLPTRVVKAEVNNLRTVGNCR